MGEHNAADGADVPGGAGAGARQGGGPGQARAGHTPVLLARCLELLAPALAGPNPVHVDATVGPGGHAEAVLGAHPAVTLVGLDRDPAALERAARRLDRYVSRVHLVRAVYDRLPEVLRDLRVSTVDSVLFDLGVSSMQLDEVGRGFSYARDAPLDMRMDPDTRVTAEEIVNGYSAAELARVLRRYGEERFAGRIADAIVRDRARGRITSSAHLAELVREAIPAAARRTGGHPAKRTFQALRIEVNDELTALSAALPAAVMALRAGGRIVVLAYHSLEDRVVKRFLTGWSRSTGPVELPVDLPGTGPRLRLLTRGAEVPGPDEVAANPRAASARLRAAERVDPEAPRGRRVALRHPRVRGLPAGRPSTGPPMGRPYTARSATANRITGPRPAGGPATGGPTQAHLFTGQPPGSQPSGAPGDLTERHRR